MGRGDLTNEQWTRLELLLPRGKANRALLHSRRIRATVPEKDGQAAHRRANGHRGGRPPASDKVVYNLQHALECGVNWPKRQRPLATRYDRLAARDQATVRVAAIDEWPSHASHALGWPIDGCDGRTTWRCGRCRVAGADGRRDAWSAGDRARLARRWL
jgi:transposase